MITANNAVIIQLSSEVHNRQFVYKVLRPLSTVESALKMSTRCHPSLVNRGIVLAEPHIVLGVVFTLIKIFHGTENMAPHRQF